MEVVVVGGGLAGINGALELADRGCRVTLVERAPTLGGLCRSVPDPLAGRVDTGQHVFLGCCSELESFLARVGAPPALSQQRLELVACTSKGEARRLRAAPLPSPLHLLPVLWRWPGVSTRQLTRVAALARSLDQVGPQQRRQLDQVSALGWLQSMGQDQRTIRALWEPFLVSACNVSLERCSAGLAALVISQGLLAGGAAAALRIPSSDLTEWLDPACRRALAAAGVEVRTRWRCRELQQLPGGRPQLTESEGERLEPDAVLLAVAARGAHRLLGGEGAGPQLTAAAQLPVSPIVNVHLFTDRPFLPGPVVVVPDSPLQWLFDRSQLGRVELRMEGRLVFHSAISLSAADQLVGVGELPLARSMWELCQRTFPAAVRAKLRHVRVTREAAATFAALPGSAAARPPAGPLAGFPRVFLAGNWTDTGWPATMEGAVRSGATAARAISQA